MALSTTAQTGTDGPLMSNESFQIQPLRAWRAIRALIKDKEDTPQVFEIMAALSGRSTPRGYARMLDTDEGGRQAYLRIEMAEKLEDRDWVARFQPGTVGAAYREFIAPRGLSAYGLADESRKVPESVELEKLHPVAWFARRIRDVHDVWHVLTGYSTDALGEACVVTFSYAQLKNFGFGFISLAAAYEFSRMRLGFPYKRALWEAYRNGKRAAWLVAEDYESLFAEPLDAARARLGIVPPAIYDSIPALYRNRVSDDPAASLVGAVEPVKS